MKKRLLNIIAVPLITLILFVYESSDPQFYFYELIWSFCISLLLWQGNTLILKSLDHYIPWRQPAAPRIFIQIGLSILMTYWISYYATQFIYTNLYSVHFSAEVFRGSLFVFIIISLLYNAIYTGSHFFGQWRKSIVEAEELKRQNLISQFESLKHQINPHFLFNSINTLVGLIDEDTELAKQYGVQFSKIYRYILDKGDEELIELKEEMKIAQIQSNLLKLRFGDSIFFEFSVGQKILSKMIPPLTLQMLIENAIKHNRLNKKDPLIISIESKNGNQLIVKNNIQAKSKGIDSTGIGIQNIVNRYQYLTDSEIEIEATEFYIVTLPLLDRKEK